MLGPAVGYFEWWGLLTSRLVSDAWIGGRILGLVVGYLDWWSDAWFEVECKHGLNLQEPGTSKFWVADQEAV